MKDQNIRDFRWGSNIPVIKSIMEYFNPTGVLELGVGRNSTPVIYEYNKKLISIETDKAWIEAVKETIPSRDNFFLIHHDLGINFRRTFVNIDKQIKKQCVKFYTQFISPDMEFLFVDHVAGLRASAIIGLMDSFKYIAYHDADEPKLYGYNHLTKDVTKNFIHILDRLPHVHTGILIRNEYSSDIEKFINVLDKHNELYCSEFNIPYDRDIIII